MAGTCTCSVAWSIPVTVSFDGGESYQLLRWMSDLQGALLAECCFAPSAALPQVASRCRSLAENFSSADLLAQLDSPNSLLILNAQQKGYFRVLYDDELWRVLHKQLATNHTVLFPTPSQSWPKPPQQLK